MAHASIMKLLFLDCDSTLSAIEGIDELARLRGQTVFDAVETLTNEAMAGNIAIAEVFPKRMEMIAPDRASAEIVAAKYVEEVDPTAAEAIETLRQQGWTPIMLSGGFAPLLEPLAEHLGIEHIEAVPLYFNPDGSYAGYDESYPTTRNNGKEEIVAELKEKWQATETVMVGDGISDLETQTVVDLFIGYGGFVRRRKVEDGADHFITSFDQLPALLSESFPL